MVRRIGGNVSDMDNLFGTSHEVEAAPRAGPNHGFAAAQLGVSWGHAVLGHDWERAVLIQMQVPKIGLANPDSVRQHDLEDRLQFPG